MPRNAHIDPLLADILNAMTPQVTEQPPAALVREPCHNCDRGDARAKAQCGPCSVCGGKGYIITESPL